MRRFIITASCALVLCATLSSATFAAVPDNGNGTAHIPIRDTYVQTSDMLISNGLPPGSTIQLSGVLSTPTNTVEQPGGTLAGRQGAAVGAVWQWQATGTGLLAGFNRPLNLALTTPVNTFPAPANAGMEVHAAPNVPFAPVQAFNTDMFAMGGQTLVDPDFDFLRITAGTNFGMPSPGVTVLTQSGPNWDVLSYFDLTYRIDFIGKAGGPLAGMSGSTTATVRIIVPEPATSALLVLPALAALGVRARRQ
jgi:hypothetical protein